jgi:hypothetical protein
MARGIHNDWEITYAVIRTRTTVVTLSAFGQMLVAQSLGRDIYPGLFCSISTRVGIMIEEIAEQFEAIFAVLPIIKLVVMPDLIHVLTERAEFLCPRAASNAMEIKKVTVFFYCIVDT